MTLIACHTNLDAARGGLANIAGDALGLRDMEPLEPAPAGWYKLVGFVPKDAVDAVARAVFATGAGRIGDYEDCAFATEGVGWFSGGPATRPAVGRPGTPERVAEVRWEVVVPRDALAAAVRAYVSAHPYEEPAFDLYPVENVAPRVGLGRVGSLPAADTVEVLAARVAETFAVQGVSWSGEGTRPVTRVAVLPGSGRGALDSAAGRCEALVTGDLGYHEAEIAAARGLSLITVPHGDFEWWSFRRWVDVLGKALTEAEVHVATSSEWQSPWHQLSTGGCAGRGGTGDGAPSVVGDEKPVVTQVRIWIDGGSRGNPGSAAIGVVLRDPTGMSLGTISRVIGVATNNVAEYRALLSGLKWAAEAGATEVEVLSDSELLVRQIRGEYRVKSEGLKLLHGEALDLARGFARFSIRHVRREENAEADALVNRALDEHEGASL
jgi:ribonuclease HI